MAMPSFETTKDEFELVCLIVDRAQAMARKISEPGFRPQIDRMDAIMDLCAAHANGNPIDFARMFHADDMNFAHDFFGINRHLDRSTGKLMNHFSPRFSSREKQTA